LVSPQIQDQRLPIAELAQVLDGIGGELDASKDRDLQVGKTPLLEPAALGLLRRLLASLVGRSIDSHGSTVGQGDGELDRKQDWGEEEAQLGVAIAGAGDETALAGEELGHPDAIHGGDHVADVDRLELAPTDSPPTPGGKGEETDGLSEAVLQPVVVEPGLPVAKGGHQLHGGQVELAAILLAQDAAQIVAVGGLEAGSIQPWEVAVDLVVDAGGSQNSCLQGEGGGTPRAPGRTEETGQRAPAQPDGGGAHVPVRVIRVVPVTVSEDAGA